MILTHRFRLSIVLVLFPLFLSGAQASAEGRTRLNVMVQKVVDGDTVIVEGGDRIRFLGIDAPEKGEEYSERARCRVLELVKEPVDLILCEERDDYGRSLAVLYKEGLNINQTLLGEGLALPMLIPPCGRMVAGEVLQASGSALLSRRGVYSGASFDPVSHENAGEKIGSRAVVRGRILRLHKGRTAWHLNFGEDFRTDFTAVLFREGQRRFRDLGLDPGDLVGREVLVLGKVKEYNGPEIIIKGPEQIIPLH